MPPRNMMPSDSEKLASAMLAMARRLRILESRTYIPPSAATWLRTTNQSIPDLIATRTPIEWGSNLSGPGFSWDISVDSGRRIFLASDTRTGPRVMLAGAIKFAAHATGRRAAFLRSYTAAGALVEEVDLFDLPSVDANDPFVAPVSMGYKFVLPTDYLRIEVAQSSGGALNLTWASLTLILVK